MAQVFSLYNAVISELLSATSVVCPILDTLLSLPKLGKYLLKLVNV